MSAAHPSGREVAALTLDVYGTLLAFEGALPAYAEMLDGQLDATQLQRFNQRFDEEMLRLFDDFSRRDFAHQPFVTVRDMYGMVLRRLCPEFTVTVDEERALEILCHFVARVPAYEDVESFLSATRGRYRLCLVSDIDDDLLHGALEFNDLRFDNVVTSQSARCYKASRNSAMFHLAAVRLGVSLTRVVHIGDAPADVLGAHRAGMRVIWLNRRGESLPADCPEPDAEAADLLEALMLLQIGL